MLLTVRQVLEQRVAEACEVTVDDGPDRGDEGRPLRLGQPDQLVLRRVELRLDLRVLACREAALRPGRLDQRRFDRGAVGLAPGIPRRLVGEHRRGAEEMPGEGDPAVMRVHAEIRSEEHTSELQSLMRISYAVF